jgi:thiol-disulfide isomerase/thioredoxin
VGEPLKRWFAHLVVRKKAMRRIARHIMLVIVILTTLSLPCPAQQSNKFIVMLKINEDVGQFSGQLIASRKNTGDFSYTSPLREGLGQAPGGVLLRIQPVADPPFAYEVWADSDGDRSLDNDTPQVVTPNSSIIVRVNRRLVDGRHMALPYTINYSREPDQRGQVRELFSWIPHYRAEGKLKVKSCEALIVLLDLTSDGLFDSEDSSQGTNIGLDRNGDGRIWGQDEYFKGEQIIEFCGESLLIDSFAVDATTITLATTDLRVPRVGNQLPAFSLTTIDDTKIESKNLRHKVHLLDFWASWCKPCVEKFTLVKRLNEEFKDDLSIIAINVDEESRLPLARQIIRDYGLPWPHVMSGRGETDSLWKMFGAIRGNHLNIPLYVLVDAQGRLRYAGNGGERLLELRSEIKRQLKKRDRAATTQSNKRLERR